MCFAWLVHAFWGRYVAARLREMAAARERSAPAMGLGAAWMVLFVAGCAALVLFFTFAAQYLFSNWAVAMAPLLIALSMITDGFVSGPIDKLNEVLEHGHAQHVPAGGGRIAAAACVVMAAAVLVAACTPAGLGSAIGWRDPCALAGWSFVVGVGAFYLASLLMLLRTDALRRAGRWLVAQVRQFGHGAVVVFGVAQRPGHGALRIAAALGLLRMLAFWGVIACALRYLLHT